MQVDWYSLIQTALQIVIFPAIWYVLRKKGKAEVTAAIAQKAFDILSLFLQSGLGTATAIERTAAQLQREEGLRQEVARRAAAGAALRAEGLTMAKARLDTLTHP